MAEKNGGTFVRFPAGKPSESKPGGATTPGTGTVQPKPKPATTAELKTPPPWTGGDGGKGWAY